MLIANTDMHMLTLLFIVFETVMFGYQFLLYLSRPQEKQRVYYLILLVLLIAKNTASGLFPDPRIHFIPLIDQYILTYGAGFMMASYFPFYFYKAYGIVNLKWHATKGIFLFLHIPFFFLFAITFFATRNIDTSINVGLAIPSMYGLILGYVILAGIKKRLREQIERREYFELIAVFLAVIPYASLAFCAYFRISQVKEVLLTNGGFIFISILFIRNSIHQSREEYRTLQEISFAGTDINHDSSFLIPDEIVETTGDDFHSIQDPRETTMDSLKLSPREREVATLLIEGLKYREIAEALGIEFGTVRTHVQNVYQKADVKNRTDLGRVFDSKQF